MISGILVLIENAAMLLALMVVFDLIAGKRDLQQHWSHQILAGLFLGSLAIGLMMASFQLEPGLIFDTRSILLSLSGLFLGTLPTLLAMAIASAYRLWLGGAGVLVGVLVILATGGVGIAWRHFRRDHLHRISFVELYAFGMVVHLIMLALMITLPGSMTHQVFSTVGLPVLLVFPLGTLTVGWLLANRIRRERSRHEIEASEVRYRGLFENMTSGFVLFDVLRDKSGRPEDLIILAANQGFEQVIGLKTREIIGRRLTEVLPGIEMDDADWIGTYGQVALSGEPTRFERRSELLNSWFAVSAFQAQPNQCAVTFTDITERKRSVEALETSERRFSHVVQHAPFPAMIHAEDGEVLHINDEWSRLTGYRRDVIPTIEDWTEKAYGDRKGVVRAVIDDLYRSSGQTQEGNFEIRCQDGSMRTWSFRSSPLGVDESGRRMVLSMAMDVTEQVSLELQLRQAQKMESIGRLAGGIAHDFNNMLGVIMGFAELAKNKVESNDSIMADLDEVLNAAYRSADLTRQLLAFARRQTIAPKVVDLNDAVKSTLTMLQRLIGEDIKLSWEPGPGHLPVFMDLSQLDQLLANLCVNARDAIGGVGTLLIQTAQVQFDEAYCANHVGFDPGDFVMLAVSDDGHGMDKETIGSIFEPFFTTKKKGEGLGLGLATVYGIVKQNHGFLNVYSEPGLGSTFKIYLPLALEQADRRVEKEVAWDLSSRGECILITEDEHAILMLAKQVLERWGYAVLTASTPSEAIEVATRHASEIQLLITDVVMPDMNGRELADKLLTLRPELKVLFMSGYTANVIAHRGVLKKDVHFVQKPFSNRELAEKVREVLDFDLPDAS